MYLDEGKIICHLHLICPAKKIFFSVRTAINLITFFENLVMCSTTILVSTKCADEVANTAQTGPTTSTALLNIIIASFRSDGGGLGENTRTS